MPLVNHSQLSYILKAPFRDIPIAYSFCTSCGQVAGGQVDRASEHVGDNTGYWAFDLRSWWLSLRWWWMGRMTGRSTRWSPMSGERLKVLKLEFIFVLALRLNSLGPWCLWQCLITFHSQYESFYINFTHEKSLFNDDLYFNSKLFWGELATLRIAVGPLVTKFTAPWKYLHTCLYQGQGSGSWICLSFMFALGTHPDGHNSDKCIMHAQCISIKKPCNIHHG